MTNNQLSSPQGVTPPLSAPKILWDQLGWKGEILESGRMIQPKDGLVAFLVVAPWCPDCREIAPRLNRQVPEGVQLYLVGEFAARAETLSFAKEFKLNWPILFGTSSKDEVSRNQARFRDLRESFGDRRRWGVPLWIEGRLVHGLLIAEQVQWFG